MKIFGRASGEMHNFWQNYTDLMSGLMIIFLIASVGYVVSKDDSRKIKAIIGAQKELADRSEFFTYNEKYNRFECTIDVKFPAYSEVHDLYRASMIPDNNRKDLINAGRELRNFIDKQKARHGVAFQQLPQRLGVTLNSVGAADHKYGVVEHPHCALGFR